MSLPCVCSGQVGRFGAYRIKPIRCLIQEPLITASRQERQNIMNNGNMGTDKDDSKDLHKGQGTSTPQSS